MWERARRGLGDMEMAGRRELAARFRKKGEYVARVIAGETIVVPIRGQVGDLEAIYNLNEVGSMIWEMMGRRMVVFPPPGAPMK